MFDWVKLALLVMQLVEKIFDYYHDKGLIDQGRREEIAAVAQQIAVKTGVRKVIMEKVDAMSEEQVDAELTKLVRPATGSAKPVHPGAG